MIEEYKGYIIEVEQDQFPDSPRNWEPLGIMVCNHSGYKLGDKQIPDYYYSEEGDEIHINTLEDVKEWIVKEYGEIAVILPLYLYDHSGITMRTTSFSDTWDSGEVGYIFVTEEKLKNEEIDKEEAEEILKDEVKTYAQYLEGDVWTSCIYEKKKCEACGHIEKEEIDGQGNVYGYDEAIELAKSTIDNLTGGHEVVTQ